MSGERKKTSLLVLCLGIVLVIGIVCYFLLSSQKHGAEPTIDNAHSIGETIAFQGIKLNIIRSYESKGTDSQRPKLQSIFTIARVVFNNDTDQPFQVNPEDFILVVDGEQLPFKPLNYVFDLLPATKLEPGATIEGAISWENPTKYRSKYILFNSPSGEKIAVNILEKD